MAGQVPRIFPIRQWAADTGETVIHGEAMNRRTALKLAAAAAGAVIVSRAPRAFAADTGDGFIDVRRPPDSVTIVTEDATADATKAAADRWTANGIEIRTTSQRDVLRVSVAAPKAAVKQVQLSWKGSTANWQSVLGDHWERSYGDLKWRK